MYYNDFLKFISVSTNSDEMKKDEFIGSLNEYACVKANESLSEIACNLYAKGLRRKIQIINVESFTSTTQIKPRIDNSDTWYHRDNIFLKIWYTIERCETK